MTTSATLGKDLTGLEHMTPEQIRLILDTAEPFKEVSERPIKKVPALRGKTIGDKHGKIAGLKVCLVGDVLHSRVARSNLWGLTKLGAEVAVCGPWTLLPRGIEDLGVKVFSRIEEAIEWADVLNVLRLQLERMEKGFIPSVREYYRVFGVTPERLERSPRAITIMHPGPMNRGVEIDSRVADGPHSVILDQVTNGVAVRMAVLYLLAGGKPELADAAKRSGGAE